MSNLLKIKSLTLRNFKAFGDVPQTIEFRPITLLFGPNSAGKSSVIQALAYLKEIVDGNIEAEYSKCGYRLAGFDELVHISKGVRANSMSLSLTFDDLGGRYDFEIDKNDGNVCAKVTSRFGADGDKRTIILGGNEENNYGKELNLLREYFGSFEHVGPLRKIIHSDNAGDDKSFSYDGSGALDALSEYLGGDYEEHKEYILDGINSFLKGEDDLGHELIFSLDDLFLRLVDIKMHSMVSFDKVGTGISQVLPILFYAACAKGILAVEQPELHLHPKIQCKLADCFIKLKRSLIETIDEIIEISSGDDWHADHDDYFNGSDCFDGRVRDIKRRLGLPVFLLETHSEHLILRLLRRIRETTDGELPDESLALLPEDLSVVCVEPGKDGAGAQIRLIRVTPDGDFADRWPGGFFAEREEELF
jgi:hypothetical protein